MASNPRGAIYQTHKESSMYNLPHSQAIGKATAQAVDRHNQKLSEPNPLYDQVIEAFEMRRQWPAGHTERILDGWLRGKRSIFGLRNQDGWIVAYLTVCGRQPYRNQFTVGVFEPGTGWVMSSNCSLKNFNSWHRRTTREIQRLEDKGAL